MVHIPSNVFMNEWPLKRPVVNSSALTSPGLWLPVPIHLFLLLPPTIPSIAVFSNKTHRFMMDRRSLTWDIFASRGKSGLFCSHAHLFVFLAFHSIHKALLKDPHFEWPFPPPLSFLRCPAFTFIHTVVIGNTIMKMILILVSSDKSLQFGNIF